MKKILNIMKYAAVSAVVCVTAVSCLEKYPGSAIPVEESMQTFADAEQHLIGIYSSLKSSNLYSGSLTLLPDIQADLAMAVLTNNNPHPDIWEWNIRPTNEEIEGVYGGLYSVIGNCNFYLDKIGEVMAAETDDDNLELLDTYTGEVYAIRALCYSELIKCFCEAYPASDADGNNPDDEAAKNMLGVVLRTKYSEPEPVRRASLYDSYQQVLSDLTRAEDLLDDGDDDPTVNEGDVYDNYYISLAAVYAIRARVALNMRNWNDAVTYSTYVIDNPAFSLSGTETNPTTRKRDNLAHWVHPYLRRRGSRDGFPQLHEGLYLPLSGICPCGVGNQPLFDERYPLSGIFCRFERGRLPDYRIFFRDSRAAPGKILG